MPRTNPRFENDTWVFVTSSEDQKVIAAYNWNAIYRLAKQLQDTRDGLIPPAGYKPDSRDYR